MYAILVVWYLAGISPKNVDWDFKRFCNNQQVKAIEIPERFQGSAANYQDDIAIVILETVIAYNIYVRPVCMDFYVNLDRKQLQPGKLGKVSDACILTILN